MSRSEVLLCVCLVKGAWSWEILSVCWKNDGEVSPEVCLGEEVRFTVRDTEIHPSSVNHETLRVHVCRHVGTR